MCCLALAEREGNKARIPICPPLCSLLRSALQPDSAAPHQTPESASCWSMLSGGVLCLVSIQEAPEGPPGGRGPPWRGDGWTCALRDAEEERAASSQTPRKASRVTPPFPCDTRALPSSVTLAEKPPRFPYLRCGGWHPSRTAFGKVFYRP